MMHVRLQKFRIYHGCPHLKSDKCPLDVHVQIIESGGRLNVRERRFQDVQINAFLFARDGPSDIRRTSSGCVRMSTGLSNIRR